MASENQITPTNQTQQEVKGRVSVLTLRGWSVRVSKGEARFHPLVPPWESSLGTEWKAEQQTGSGQHAGEGRSFLRIKPHVFYTLFILQTQHQSCGFTVFTVNS